jgi:lipid II:glycine glycyltransferase (peptidoglycan interpeptide bridge formation enzyme)
MDLINLEPENWNENINDVSCAKEFAKANNNEGEVYYFQNYNSKAIIIIKKKYLKVFSRAQVFTESTNTEFLKKIINQLKSMKVPFARIGNTMFGLSKSINNFENSKVIKRHTFILDLKKSLEDIWTNFDKKLRNVIRKSEKEGVIVSEISNEEELKEYYELSKHTEKEIQENKGKKTFSIQTYDFFKEIFKNKIGKYMIAKLNGKIIAGALFLVWKNKALYYQSGMDRSYHDKQAPSLIQWEAIKKFKELEIKEYDLGGVTLGLDKKDSRYFVYEFKRKFNGELKEFYNIEVELSKIKKLQDFVIKTIYK